jgi:hypothetical protein
MSLNTKGYLGVYPKVGPEDRFLAQEEVKALLKSKHVDLDCVLDLLFKSDDGCVDFCFGDIVIQFVHGFGVWSERRNVIQMTVELQKGDVGEAVGYEYTLDELGRSHARKLTGLDIQEQRK